VADDLDDLDELEDMSTRNKGDQSMPPQQTNENPDYWQNNPKKE